MGSVLESIAGYFKGQEPALKLRGQHKDTFCYLSIRDRHPVTITKIIDNTFKLGCQNKELEQDAKDVSAKLSRLKSRLQTDKELELLDGTGADVNIWNNVLRKLQSNTWFAAPWLVIECYMYRYIHEVFQCTASLKYPHYDTFREEKCAGLQESLTNMASIAILLKQSHDKPHDLVVPEFIKLSLWGNKTDLSLLKHFNLELGDVQSTNVKTIDHMILCNDLEKVTGYLLSLKDAQIDIVLDNAGYELFGDLCLAEVLVRSPHVKSVRFHMKSMPWFVSDVTDFDMQYMIDTLKDSPDECLSELGNQWESRFNDNTFARTAHPFWTSPHGFCDMETVSPALFNDLSTSDFTFFKGDLNYRKLVNDRQWPYDTCLVTAMEGFNPGKLCALRTIKSDSIVGCQKEVVEKILEGDKNMLFFRAYALISSNL